MTAPLPRLPHALRLAALPLPLRPLSLLLGALTRRMAQAHPEMTRRMGDHADRHFLIDPVDLPWLLLLHPQGQTMTAHRRSRPPACDARIAGPLSAFLAMMHGAEDGDALFFSRDLAVEGDTAAVLALRNAIDDAELDLAGELAALSGPLAGPLRQALLRAERASGLTLHRQDDFA
ncbi:ubiquinone anaerobic biosynthesis accessory factor UbiT [Gemmobacter caeruleus]|uniref:ubiquinone anaerobic biosynthesis accessory factor UbiT n=1 Tax=Gemmobacter caeruleus TaxID=2595004 RepID=UPI0011F008F4|nr:SCP2 sterol-binding domain-containing protein [Gemmobacter caeruleus]